MLLNHLGLSIMTCHACNAEAFKNAKRFAHDAAVKLVHGWAHDKALSQSGFGKGFIDYYMMFYRVHFEGMYDQAFKDYVDLYMTSLIETFKGDTNDLCIDCMERYLLFTVIGSTRREPVYVEPPKYPEIKVPSQKTIE